MGLGIHLAGVPHVAAFDVADDDQPGLIGFLNQLEIAFEPFPVIPLEEGCIELDRRHQWSHYVDDLPAELQHSIQRRLAVGPVVHFAQSGDVRRQSLVDRIDSNTDRSLLLFNSGQQTISKVGRHNKALLKSSSDQRQRSLAPSLLRKREEAS